jgi:hypothetical protein
MVMLHNETKDNNLSWLADETPLQATRFKDVVLEDQEIFRQIVKVANSQIFFLVQYEMSVLESP